MSKEVWPLKLITRIGTEGVVGSKTAWLECGHKVAEATSHKWGKRVRCHRCALDAKEIPPTPEEIGRNFKEIPKEALGPTPLERQLAEATNISKGRIELEGLAYAQEHLEAFSAYIMGQGLFTLRQGWLSFYVGGGGYEPIRPVALAKWARRFKLQHPEQGRNIL